MQTAGFLLPPAHPSVGDITSPTPEDDWYHLRGLRFSQVGDVDGDNRPSAYARRHRGSAA